VIRIANHAHKVAQELREGFFRNARSHVGDIIFTALYSTLDGDTESRSHSSKPLSLSINRMTDISQFILNFEQFTEYMENQVKERKAKSLARRKENRTGKGIEKNRAAYFNDLAVIFALAGGSPVTGRGEQLTGFESFVADVTEKIPHPPLEKYYKSGLETALRKYFKTPQCPIPVARAYFAVGPEKALGVPHKLEANLELGPVVWEKLFEVSLGRTNHPRDLVEALQGATWGWRASQAC
jgi:hypothetical protein